MNKCVLASGLCVLIAQAPTADVPVAQTAAAALADLRSGRYEQALAGFDRCIAARGADAEPQLLLNAAMCALHLQRSRDAEQRLAALVDDERWAPEAAFLSALAHSQDAERAVAAARLADAEPMAWVMAVRSIGRAEAWFRRCCRLRPDWPAAVRNLERILRRRRDIEAERDAASPPEAKQEQVPEPEQEPPEPPADAAADEVAPEVPSAPLTATELRRLVERVRQQQQAKVRGRQQRARAASGGERDW